MRSGSAIKLSAYTYQRAIKLTPLRRGKNSQQRELRRAASSQAYIRDHIGAPMIRSNSQLENRISNDAS